MQTLEKLIQDLTSGNENRAEKSARFFPDYGEDGLKALMDLFTSPFEDTRWWAVRAMAAFDPDIYPKASAYLIKGLEDPDPSVQACAAVGLREKPAPAGIPTLIKMLSHSDKLVARMAGDALVALKKASTTALIELLDRLVDDHSIAKVEAVRALALIGDPSSISTLFKVWENGSSMVQHWAEKGLNDMGIGMAFFDPGN